jgi:uncharacterized membrane protein
MSDWDKDKTEENFRKLLDDIKGANKDKEENVGLGCLKAIVMLLIAPFLAVLNLSMISWTIVVIWGWLLAEVTGFVPDFMVVFGGLIVLGLTRVPQVLAIGIKEHKNAGFIHMIAICVGVAFSCGISLLLAWMGIQFFV